MWTIIILRTCFSMLYFDEQNTCLYWSKTFTKLGFVGYEISWWRQPPNFQPLNGSNFWNTCLIWMNSLSLGSYHVIIFIYNAFDHFHVMRLLKPAVFHWLPEKCHVILFNPIQLYLIFLVYSLVTNVWDHMEISQKAKNWGVNHLQGISGSY